jgi:acyl carrier protein
MDDRRDAEMALETIVRETLGVVLGRGIAPGDPVRRDDQPDWDSLKHIELVFALEDALGVRFDADEIGELTDVGSIVERAGRHNAS